MAKLFVTVFPDATQTLLGTPTQYLSQDIGAGSLQTGAISGAARATSRRCRLFAEADCFIAIGANPTVTDGTDGIPLGSENPEVLGIETGYKIAVIQRTVA